MLCTRSGIHDFNSARSGLPLPSSLLGSRGHVANITFKFTRTFVLRFALPRTSSFWSDKADNGKIEHDLSFFFWAMAPRMSLTARSFDIMRQSKAKQSAYPLGYPRSPELFHIACVCTLFTVFSEAVSHVSHWSYSIDRLASSNGGVAFLFSQFARHDQQQMAPAKHETPHSGSRLATTRGNAKKEIADVPRLK